jgi:hypothetical protein
MASAAGSSWRLWQIVGLRPSLEDALNAGLAEPLTARTVEILMSAAERLAAAAMLFPSASIGLIPTPSSVAADALPPRYIDLMPAHDADPTMRPDRSTIRTIVTARFGGVVEQYARQFGADRLVDAIQAHPHGTHGRHAATSLLIELLQQKQTA